MINTTEMSNTAVADKKDVANKSKKQKYARNRRRAGKGVAARVAVRNEGRTSLVSKMNMQLEYHRAATRQCNRLKNMWYAGLVVDKYGDLQVPALLSDWIAQIGRSLDVIQDGSIYYEVDTPRHMVSFYWIEKPSGKRIYLDTFSYDLLARETLMHQLKYLSRRMNSMRSSNLKDSAEYKRVQTEYNRTLDVLASNVDNKQIILDELNNLSAQWAALDAYRNGDCKNYFKTEKLEECKRMIRYIENRQRILLHAIRHFPKVLKKVYTKKSA